MLISFLILETLKPEMVWRLACPIKSIICNGLELKTDSPTLGPLLFLHPRLDYCSKSYTLYLTAIIFAKRTWQSSCSKEMQCLWCVAGSALNFFFFFKIFIIAGAALPPPHRRHLARSLPVPRGRMATGGCLTTLAFSVELKK